MSTPFAIPCRKPPFPGGGLVFPRGGKHLLLPLLLICGCAKSTDLSQAELDAARDAVEKALEGWKKGETPKQLRQRTTPLDVTDPDWEGRARLLSFQVTRMEGQQGAAPRCWVRLTLQDRQGKRLEKEVVYEVKTKGKIVIVRDPFF